MSNDLDRHRARLAAWRALTPARQMAEFHAGEGMPEGAVEDPGDRLRAGIWCPCIRFGGAESHQLTLAASTDPDRVRWMGAVATEGAYLCDPGQAARLGALLPVAYGRDAAAELAARCDVIVSWSSLDPGPILAGIARPPAIVQLCHFPEAAGGIHGNGAPGSGVGPDGTVYVAVSPLAVLSLPGPLRTGATVIPNAVDAGRLLIRRDRQAMRRHWGIPDGQTVLGYLGRLSPEKRPGVMLAIARILRDRGIQVVIVGEGPMRAELEGQVVANRLDNVRIVGPDIAAGDVLAGFDAVTVPSAYESFGLTIAEAWWIGCPVISEAVGVAALAPGLVAHVAAGAPPEVWAAAAAAMLAGADPAAAGRTARASEFAHAQFKPERFGARWTRLLLSLRPPGGPRAAPPTRIPSNIQLAMRAELCPCGTGPCGCGEGPPRSCGHPDRPDSVRQADCIRCQARQWWEAPR